MILKKSNTTQHTKSLKDSSKKISITYRKSTKNLNIPPPFLSINKLPFLIAEIGGNHEGDFSKAKKYLELAIESGVDCVKFQLYKADSLVNKKLSPKRHKHYKKFELLKSEHIELAKICINNKIKYNASVWDLEMLEWIDEYLDFYKIGSGDMTCWPLIEEFAKRGKPILLSTGLSNYNEVLKTIEFIREVNSDYINDNMLCVLQCTSMYPISYSDVNLNVINEFKKIKNITVGYSDHTIGDEALIAATTLGCSVLEFHFTDSRKNKEFRDHQVSLTKDEVKGLIKKVKKVKSILGTVSKKLLKIEKENKHHISFRRGIYPKTKIKKGQIIKENDLIFLRPLKGTDARNYQKVIGSTSLSDIEPLQPLYENKDYKIE